MRIKLTPYNPDLTPAREPRWVSPYGPSDEELFEDDQIIDLLARVSVVEVILKRPDGTWVCYSNVEYECIWCGAYDHNSSDCPDGEDPLADTDDPFDERDYEVDGFRVSKGPGPGPGPKGDQHP